MFWRKSPRSRESMAAEERAMRRLFEAASAGAPPTEPPPYFMTRLKGAIAERQRAAAAHPIGAAAWQMLPALTIILALLTAWTGYESVRAERAQKAAMARIMDPSAAGGDVFLAIAFLSGTADAAHIEGLQ